MKWIYLYRGHLFNLQTSVIHSAFMGVALDQGSAHVKQDGLQVLVTLVSALRELYITSLIDHENV